MKKQIFRSICIVALIVFTACLVLIMGVLYDYFSGMQMNQLKNEATLAAGAVETGGIDYLKSLSNGNYRITWISPDGGVLFDNKANAKEMGNHLEREEVKEALKNGEGESSRYSTTLTERQLYCAKKLKDGSVIRLSGSHLSWWALILAMLQPIIIVVAVAVILSLVLAFRVSNKIVKPLNSLDLDNPDPKETYEELAPVITRIVSQQNQLRRQQADLSRQKQEFNTATKNMNEGLLLLNENGMILSINRYATEILGISSYCVGKDLSLLNNSLEIEELLDQAKEKKHAEKVITIKDNDYRFNASAVISEEKVCGVALIIFDITEKEKAEQVRKEFTANVSHELKTPLQNISGYAELLSDGLVKPEDIQNFSGKIYSEAKRMIVLVEDIINLSHLDEGAEDMKWQETDLCEIAKQSIGGLLDVAEKENITVSFNEEPAVIYGAPQLLAGIVYNLCDNAIKYNHKGGRVDVKISNTEKHVVLSVSDTGIGIPPEAKDRIFERFYRVDKSRSKEVGGTGLGLSIVKHAARLHNAEIKLESELGKGTSITVEFPRKNK